MSGARYRLLAPLGRGGMAEVFLADDVHLGRQVAVKFLAGALADDPSAQERLQREARAAAALDHPFVCKVFDTGLLDGRPFIAMEYVRGETLRARMDAGRLAPSEARDAAKAIAAALADAHQHGIVHRDLKPANIMLTEHGHVKVMDFGLARRVVSDDADRDATASGPLTEIGARLGTPAYMSPEQVLGAVVGRASDVFAYGVVLVEMLGAPHPFMRDTAAATMGAIVRDRPALPATWPHPLREWVERLLAKDPSERPSFATIATDLDGKVEWIAEGGVAQSSGVVRGERRTATVLAAIVNAVRDDRADDEAAVGAGRDAVEMALTIVTSHGGSAIDRRHDGFVSVFGAPDASEDASLGAVEAALAMRDALASTTTTVHIGLHTGPVAIEGLHGGRARVTPLGDTARTAERLSAAAASGEVRLSASLAPAVAAFFDVVDASGSRGAGVIVRHATTARRRFDAARQRGLTPLVGRGDELALLRSHARQAFEGEGRIVLVSAEAGLGKTRLLHELCRTLEGTGAQWIEASCAARSSGTPYFALARLVRQAFGLRDEDDPSLMAQTLDARTSAWQPGTRQTLPFLKTVLNLDPGDPVVARLDPIEHRLGIHRALAALTTELAGTSPVVLVMEDLHWVDGPSHDAVVAAADLMASLPILLVLTHRPGFLDHLGARSYVHRLSLSALSAGTARALVRAVLGDAEVPDQVADVVSSRTGGNPLYIEEVARSLEESGAITRDGGAYTLDRRGGDIRVPHTIEQLLLARIDRLPAEAREVLQAAAVLGRECTTSLLMLLPLSAASLDVPLQRLKDAELVREVARFPEPRYAFGHALVQEVAASTLLTGRKRELHRAAVRAIEHLQAVRLADEYERLALHAIEGQLWDVALDYCERAADRAAGLGSVDEACAFYRRAIGVCAEIGDDATTRALDVFRKLAEMLTAVGRLPEAFAALRGMQQLARNSGDRRREAIAFALEGWARGLGHESAASVAASKTALEMAAPNDDGVRFLASGSLALFLYANHRVEEARPYLQMSQALAPRVDDSYRHAWWGVTRWHYLQWEGRLDEAIADLAHWQKAAEQSRSHFITLGRQWLEAVTRASRGDYDVALARLHELLAACDRVGSVYVRIRTLNTIGWIHTELEDHSTALEWNRRGVTEAIEAGEPHPEVESNARLNVADSLMTLGDFDGAEAEFRHVEAIVRHPEPHQTADLWRYAQHLFHSYGELCLLRGDAHRALAYADECLALAEPANHAKNVAKGRRLRGAALTALGNLARAGDDLAAALAAAERVGNPPQLWKTLAAIGDLRRAEARTVEAQAAYTRALGVIDTVAVGLADETLREAFLTSAHVQSVRERTTV
jgi:class 3 adenylate cyclase/tetratricopeptide (TPR) repeat protein/predicted Ser/Thr protein kinase